MTPCFNLNTWNIEFDWLVWKLITTLSNIILRIFIVWGNDNKCKYAFRVWWNQLSMLSMEVISTKEDGWFLFGMCGLLDKNKIIDLLRDCLYTMYIRSFKGIIASNKLKVLPAELTKAWRSSSHWLQYHIISYINYSFNRVRYWKYYELIVL